jgi:hypothetical protein
MGSVAVHRIQHKLHQLHDGIFPLLQDKGIPSEDIACSEENGVVKTVPEPVHEGHSLSKTASQSEDSVICGLKNGEEGGTLVNEDSVKMTESTFSHKTVSDVFSLIQARTFCSVHLRPRKGLDR